MSNKPQHAPITQFPIVNDELVIGDVPLTKLAEHVGSTPFYAYDKNAITRRVQNLRQQLPQALHLHYAIKANPFPPLLNHLASLTDGLDVASEAELMLALESGTDSEHISFAGPGKSDADLAAAIRASVTLNVESSGELQRILVQSEQTGIQPRLALRVNPDFELKSSGMQMSGGSKPFGIDSELIPGLLKEMQAMDISFQGFHIFSGSQNLNAQYLIDAQNATLKLAYQLAEHTSLPIPSLNIGGGFGIPYFPGEQALDMELVADNLHKLIQDCQDRIPGTQVILELGRYLVGEAGIYVCKVIDRKVSRGQTYLVVNGGMHHHLAASGNFGQIIRKNYPVVMGAQVSGGKREQVSVVGPLCTPLDVLAGKMELAEAKVGDLVVVLQSGAYGYSASPMDFLSHPLPKEILV